MSRVATERGLYDLEEDESACDILSLRLRRAISCCQCSEVVLPSAPSRPVTAGSRVFRVQPSLVGNTWAYRQDTEERGKKMILSQDRNS